MVVSREQGFNPIHHITRDPAIVISAGIASGIISSTIIVAIVTSTPKLRRVAIGFRHGCGWIWGVFVDCVALRYCISMEVINISWGVRSRLLPALGD